MKAKRAFIISIFVVLLGMMSSAAVFAESSSTDISAADITAVDKEYIGTEVEPEITVTLNGTILVPNTDYKVNYDNHNLTDAHIVYFKINGFGHYTGEKEGSFQIKAKPITITAKDQTFVYNGEPQGESDPVYDDPAQIESKVTVSGLLKSDKLSRIVLNGQGTDVGVYPIEPSCAQITDEHGNAETGNYQITYVNGKLTITPRPSPRISIYNAPVVLAPVPLIYTGTSLTPTILTIGGRELTEGTDYTVRYSREETFIESPVDAGTYTMIITGRGRYIGSTSTDFVIRKASGTMTAEGKTVGIKSKTKKLKKARTISAAKAYDIQTTIGQVTYSKVQADKSSGKFSVDPDTGTITVRKGLKRGTYRLTVNVCDPGDDNHNAADTDTLVTIKVKK